MGFGGGLKGVDIINVGLVDLAGGCVVIGGEELEERRIV